MDSFIVRPQRLGEFAIVQSRGGMITVRERAVLAYGEKSLVQNLRCWHPGFETRKGYSKNNSTAYNASSDSPLNIYEFVKGKVSEKHLFAQFGDTKLLEATNIPPASGTTFGTVVHDGSTGQLPAAFSNINDFMVYSNGADQHQVYAGQDQDVETFVVARDSGAHDLYPDVGEDYSTEVRDENSGVAILDSLDDLAVGYDCIYFMTKTPIDELNWVLAAFNSNIAKFKIDYWNGAWTNDAITDGTLTGGNVTLGQDGSMVFATTADDRTDEIPRYMYNESGFWYRLYLEDFSDPLDLTTFTEVDNGGDLTITSTVATFTTMATSADNYVYYDFGAGFFGDFEVNFDFEITAVSAPGESETVMLCGFSDTIGNITDFDTANDGMYASIVEAGGISFVLRIRDESNGNQNDASIGSYPLVARTYCTLNRTGTTLTMKTYTDAARQNNVEDYDIVCENGTLRYFYCLASKGGGPASTISGDASNHAINRKNTLDSEVEASSVTYDCESFIDLVNVWNGVPIDLVEAQLFDDSEDVWDVYAASAITLSEMTSSDELYLSSAQQLEAIYFGFGNTPNATGAPAITIEFWNGAAWTGVTEVDGTGNWTETGWISFGRQTGEFKRQFRSTKYYAYWYKITISSTLSDDVVASVLGMPYFDIKKLGSIGRTSATWKNRALYSFNKFPRDLYVSEANEHMKLNGTDFAILQPGDGRDNATVASVNFHNEIMVFQEELGSIGGCVTIFEGYSPATFGKLVLSTKIGTFSPKTVRVVDGSKTSTTKSDLNSQTQVYFLSHYGVFMSDGRIVTGVSDDIQNYFDQRFSECIRTGYESEMWLEHDSTENVIKIGIVSGSTATTCNKYFVYDLSDGVWYEDVYATSLSVAREVEAGSGQFFTRLISAGSTTGFVYLMNDGTTDDGTAITSKITWEFNNGAYFISVHEFLTRAKVSDGNTYTLTMEENDVQVFNETGALTAYKTNETMIRNRHLCDLDQRAWCSVSLTAAVPIYLYDCGIDASSVSNK